MTPSLKAVRREIAFRRRVVAKGPPDLPAPFICGAGRSGTTLLRLMVDAHPEVAIPSESHFVPDVIKRCLAGPVDAETLTREITESNRWGDFHLDAAELGQRIAAGPARAGDATRTFFRLYAEGQGKTRWGDKTPGYAELMPVIERTLPEARFIHVIRDGRDVALSILARDWGPDTIEKAAKRWKRRIQRARRGAERLPAGHYMELRYEDLITDTERELRRVCEHIELEFDPEMLRYHERAEQRLAEKARELTRAGGGTTSAEARAESHKLASEPPKAEHLARWKREMSAEDVAEFERVAGGLLTDCGYQRSST